MDLFLTFHKLNIMLVALDNNGLKLSGFQLKSRGKLTQKERSKKLKLEEVLVNRSQISLSPTFFCGRVS